MRYCRGAACPRPIIFVRGKSMFNDAVLKRWSKGMTILEYSLLIAALLAALMGMQLYLRRAVSSKWREAADTFGMGRQYEDKGSRATVITEN
jgi:hypothetical protein